MTTILGIESSCDETATAILTDGKMIASNVSSQINLHSKFGGVVPEVACRAHMEALIPLLEEVFKQADIKPSDIDAVAVTNRPGLIGALLVGVLCAKGLALALNKSMIGVNHIEAHIAVCRMIQPELTPPYAALVVSGGHTQISLIKTDGTQEILEQTKDDAAGEAFDKAAKLLDLGFPGGPAIQKAAEKGNQKAFRWSSACLPRNSGGFSFSGIKTAVLYAARGQAEGRKGALKLDEQGVCDAAASFQYAVVRALVKRTIEAAVKHKVNWIALGGGVAANQCLRNTLQKAAASEKINLAVPPMRLCVDNAEMIAFRGWELYQQGMFCDLDMPTYSREGI